MYEPGKLRVAPAGCKLDEDGDCEEFSHDHPNDSRDNYKKLFGGAYLPHSCDSWVVGGPDAIRALIRDLKGALKTLGKPK